MKLGCIEDRENHKRIAPLLRFFSSQSEEEMISLDEYVENMKPDQKDIYYIAADSVTSAKNTPFLERILQKDLEVRSQLCFIFVLWVFSEHSCHFSISKLQLMAHYVFPFHVFIQFVDFSLSQVLYLVDPIDEVAIQNLKSYKEKNFVDISKEDLDLG